MKFRKRNHIGSYPKRQLISPWPNTECNDGQSAKGTKNKSTNIKKLAQEYTDATSIHGLRYIGEEGRHLSEKFAKL